MRYLCIVQKDKAILKILIKMKYKELYKRLQRAGCSISRNGANHDMWYSPLTGQQKPVPRHGSKEVPTGLLKAIEKDLLGL